MASANLHLNLADTDLSKCVRVHINREQDNIHNYLLEIKCGDEYKEPLPFQTQLVLAILNLGSNFGSSRDIITTKIGNSSFEYYAYLNMKNGNMYIINDTTKKIRHVKYQREGLIIEKNLKRHSEESTDSNKKQKSSS